MRFLTLTIAAALAGCQTMQSQDTAKGEVTAAVQVWAEAFNKCDSAKITSLYDAEPVLWGTVSPAIITTAAGVRQYFDRVCASSTPPKVAFTEQVVQVLGDTAVASGGYTFTITRDGKAISFPARFTMTYHRNVAQWLIVNHHSSARPAPPKP